MAKFNTWYLLLIEYDRFSFIVFQLDFSALVYRNEKNVCLLWEVDKALSKFLLNPK